MASSGNSSGWFLGCLAGLVYTGFGLIIVAAIFVAAAPILIPAIVIALLIAVPVGIIYLAVRAADPKQVRADLSVDWAERANTEASIRSKIKRIVRRPEYRGTVTRKLRN